LFFCFVCLQPIIFPVLKRFPIINAEGVMKQSRCSKRLDSKEGNGGLSEDLLHLYSERYPDTDHGDRPSRIKERKGVVYEPERSMKM
jgi:hypothetical protein